MKENEPVVVLYEYPSEEDWLNVKRRALITAGKTLKQAMNCKAPDKTWKMQMLEARHSPIRRLHFSFYIENCPYYISTHLARHVHAQPYICSQRNDRQDKYDRREAPQSAPVNMIFDVNAEELMVIANKRLCTMADIDTRKLVRTMCDLVVRFLPEFNPFLVPMCEYQNHICHERLGCGRCPKANDWSDI